MTDLDSIAKILYDRDPEIQSWDGDPYLFHEPGARRKRERAEDTAMVVMDYVRECFTASEDKEPHIRNAMADITSVRSDILSQLGSNHSDLFLKASFAAGLDSAEENLRRALR